MKITFVYGAGIQLPVPLISISYLSAAVKASGRHTVSLIDCYMRGDKLRYVLSRIREEKPDVVGFSVMSSYVESSLRMAMRIKEEFPALKIVFGGVHAILRPGEIMACGAVDAVCTGEGEETLVEFLDRLQEGAAPAVKGFWYRSGGRVEKDETRTVIADLNSLAFPDWDIWDMSVYTNSLMYVLGSRGCPFSCAYCCTSALREKLCGGDFRLYYRTRSARSIVDEVSQNLRRNGYKGFQPLMFADSIFGLEREKFREFTRLYVQEGLHKSVPWKCLVVASAVDDEWAGLAGGAGCFAVDMGLEHPDEKFRTGTLGKNLTDADFHRAAAALKKHGIPYELYLMIGSTGETLKDVMKSLWSARRYSPLFFCINVYVPLPGTKMWEQYEAKKAGRGLPYIEKKEGAFENCLWLVWGVKFFNQLGIILIALRLHGLRMVPVFFSFLTRFLRPGTSFVDCVRLFNHHVQQYYIYRGLAAEIRKGTYPAAKDLFYRRKAQ